MDILSLKAIARGITCHVSHKNKALYLESSLRYNTEPTERVGKWQIQFHVCFTLS